MAAPPTPSRHTDQALAAAGTCGFSALAVLMAGTLMLSIGGLVALGFVLALGSGAIAAALGLMALCLTLAALVAGMLSTAAAGTYASLATAQGTLRLLSGLVAPGGAKGTGVPASQPARLKELPRESPAREAIALPALKSPRPDKQPPSPVVEGSGEVEAETTSFALPVKARQVADSAPPKHVAPAFIPASTL